VNVTSALQGQLLPTLVPMNAKSALQALLKATESNVWPALLAPSPLKLLKMLKNAILALLVPSPRLLAPLTV